MAYEQKTSSCDPLKQCYKIKSTGQLQPHPPIFFKKVEIFIPLEVYTYVVTACLILLATST